ncbi:sensor histidine kinase [Streptomyces sp. NPDC055709]
MISFTKLVRTMPVGQADGMGIVTAPYQRRAQITQGILRIIIVVALFADLIRPPTENFAISLAIVTSYAAWSVALLLERTRIWLKGSNIWFPILIDLITVTIYTALVGGFTDPRAQPQNLFLLVPILAAFQYRPALTIATTIASAATFAIGIEIGRSDKVALIFSQLIVIVGVACVLLSWIQQAKMRSIVRLAEDRSALVARVMSAEDRERSALAETLHDGALQNVIAARQDIEDLQGDPNAAQHLGRTYKALADAIKQLRTSVSTLHPAVLDNAGLAPALRILIEEAAERGGFFTNFDCRVEETGTAEHMLYRTARELLVNAVKHSRASTVSVRLWMNDGMVHLEVADDGVGMPAGALDRSVVEGHIGLASHRIRVEEAGGRFEIRTNFPKGTVAVVSLPY